MLKQRVITAIVLVVLVLAALFALLAWPLATAQGPSGAMLAHLLALGPIAAFSARALANARQPDQEPLNP